MPQKATQSDGTTTIKLRPEDIKNIILQKEWVKEYSSEKFQKIEQRVKENLWKQSTDDALKDITVWALIIGSSDIHFEMFEFDVKVRFRIDWVLADIFSLSKKEYKAILERLKYAAGLKLNISDVPQDGKYAIKTDEGKKIDVRVSTLPIKYWENVVCRILDSEKSIVDFKDLWFFWTSKRMIERALSKKNGMILVTWPTGSWKTTTLYTMLSKLNTREKKIITLEDPIEYEMPWVIQSEVSERTGFTFETWLKALLRQDPNIIMVWEIRDLETLMTATNASLTWHLVLSTLHTKSAAETLDRLISMWLKPYLLASALDTIIAQRLVRRICENCKTEKTKSPEEVNIITTMMEDIWMKSISAENIKLFKWTGCDKCSQSGYKWRIGIYEIISLNEKIRDIIRWWWTVEKIILEAKNGDLISMKEDGILKAIRGHTTIEELLRVI